jgi:hypothetical protein
MWWLVRLEVIPGSTPIVPCPLLSLCISKYSELKKRVRIVAARKSPSPLFPVIKYCKTPPFCLWVKGGGGGVELKYNKEIYFLSVSYGMLYETNTLSIFSFQVFKIASSFYQNFDNFIDSCFHIHFLLIYIYIDVE